MHNTIMNTIFEEKKHSLLQILHHLALHHNRDYYVSMIPIVEKLEPDDRDILESYQQAIDMDYWKLFQSKEAFSDTRNLIEFLITLQ